MSEIWPIDRGGNELPDKVDIRKLSRLREDTPLTHITPFGIRRTRRTNYPGWDLLTQSHGENMTDETKLAA